MDFAEKRKKKKDNKRAKHKKHEKKKNLSSSDNDSSDCDEWIETSTAASVSATKSESNVQRDEWMNSSDFVPTFSNNDLKATKNKSKKEEERQLRTLDKPGQHERELNPYWKDGGKGLPTTEEETSKAVSYKAVGDGGVNWLRRAYRRVVDQAKEEGRSEEDIAKERWGSLERLKALLRDAEEKAGSRDQQSHDRHQRSSSFQSLRHESNKERTFHRPRDDECNYQKRRDEDLTFHRPRDEERSFHRRKDEERSFHKPRDEESRFQRSRNDDRTFQKPKVEERTFIRPKEESDNLNYRKSSHSSSYQSDRPRWQKTDFKSKSELGFKTPREDEAALSSKSESNRNLEADKAKRDSPRSTGDEPNKKGNRDSKPVPETLTKKEMNELGAKIIKAELLGNNELAEKLKARLNAANEASVNKPKATAEKPELVLLTQSNSRGLVTPLVCSSSSGAVPVSGNKRKMNKLQTHRDGERVCYFQDDSKYTLQQMFQKEKFTTADDETAMYLRLAGGKTIKTDDDFSIDDALLNRQERYEPEEKQAERQRNRAIKEHKHMNKVSENCSFCLDSKHMQKHLIVALGNKAYISLPSNKSLEDGHCYIVPMSHVPATTHLDEDVWEEVQLFRKTLTAMFKSQDKDVVFMETSLHLRRHPHAFLECIPLSMELGSLAPMYFKKAILECDTEWAQNKRLVDLSKKDVRHSVPKGLPYFAVDFGLDGGFAHVVEDEQLFPDFFGREILGGMLDLEPRMWKKPQKENFKDQSQKVLEFEKWWKPFDLSSR